MLRFQADATMPGFFTWVLNSDPHTCKASMLATELLLQPHVLSDIMSNLGICFTLTLNVCLCGACRGQRTSCRSPFSPTLKTCISRCHLKLSLISIHTHRHTRYALKGPVTIWVHGIELLWVTFLLVFPNQHHETPLYPWCALFSYYKPSGNAGDPVQILAYSL